MTGYLALLGAIVLAPLPAVANMNLVPIPGQNGGWLQFAVGTVDDANTKWSSTYGVDNNAAQLAGATMPPRAEFLVRSDRTGEVAQCSIEGPGREGVITSFQMGYVPPKTLTVLSVLQQNDLAIGMCGCYAGHLIKCTSRKTGKGLRCLDSTTGPAKTECMGKTFGWAKDHREAFKAQGLRGWE